MTASALPTGLEQAFKLSAGELGMCSAAWMFVDTVGERAGAAGVSELQDELGRAFPVLDAVCRGWLEGQREGKAEPSRLLETLRSCTRVLVVGLEARFVDALVDAAPATLRIGLLRSNEFQVSWPRVTANYAERIELVDLSEFQRWAGARAALLTFLYGGAGEVAFTVPSWLRVMGPDVRTQFRSFIGWEVLRRPITVYPRWLVQVETSSFTETV